MSPIERGSAEDASPPDPIAPWSHVTIAPPAAWVEPSSFDSSLRAKEGVHVTYLLWERQVNCDLSTSFHTSAVRLESSAAVQHQSQWKLNLDPRIHHLTLHWLRVVRGAQTFDQLRRDRMRLIQRETQLEHLVIDGQWTLLVVLDDVRVGDVIEAAYSFAGPNPIRPEGCEAFFVVPPTVVVGSYHLRIEFDPSRTDLKWLASPDAPERTEEKLSESRVRWSWRGEQPSSREPEPQQPSGFLDYVWIQVSDLGTWTPLATRLAEVWNTTDEGAAPGELPGFPRPPVVDTTAVHGLIRHLQDEFRYLAVDLETGGWIPSRPPVVAQRRYGDCKNLVWLATGILRSWGVVARPILVGTGLRGRVKDMLPIAHLFNHAVLEVEQGGERRWFDLTLRHQGGDYRSQPVPWFGHGLPVEAGASLVSQPGEPPRGSYFVRETVDLDTRRSEPSVVDIRVRVEGWNAEHLRQAHTAKTADEFAQERLALVRRRYGKAERIGQLQWRDDRTRNVCEVAEAFEIRDVIAPDESGRRALFDVPSNLLIQTFAVPEEKPRRAPWDLPSRIDIRHEICVRHGSLGTKPRLRRRWVCPEFSASLDEPRDAGAWKKIMRFTLETDEVPAERVASYRRVLDRFLRATTWRFYLPPNQRRVKSDVPPGALPPPSAGAEAYVAPACLEDFADATDSETTVAMMPAGSSSSPWRSTSQWWRLAIPAVLALGFVAQQCSPESADDPAPFASAPPPASGAMIPAGIEIIDPDVENQPLPTGPEIHGFVYSHPNEVDQVPQPLSRPPPAYPKVLKLAGVEGEATIRFVVTDQGVPTRITIVSATNSSFGRAATLALAQWRYRPAMKAGQPVNMAVQIPFKFNLYGANPSKGFDLDNHLWPSGGKTPPLPFSATPGSP